MSIALNIIENAIQEIAKVSKKNEETLIMLQQNINQVSAQKIALQANEQLLVKLKASITAEEHKNSANVPGGNTHVPIINADNF